jgi:hypothetical protein
MYRHTWPSRQATVAISHAGSSSLRFWTIGLAPRRGTRRAAVRFPAGDSKGIHTSNAAERLNSSFRQIIKTRGNFPNDEAALEILFFQSAMPAFTRADPLSGEPRLGNYRSCSAIALMLQL